jgi:hypothetical protein
MLHGTTVKMFQSGALARVPKGVAILEGCLGGDSGRKNKF